MKTLMSPANSLSLMLCLPSQRYMWRSVAITLTSLLILPVSSVSLTDVVPNQAWGSHSTTVKILGEGFAGHDIATTICDIPCAVVPGSLTDTSFDCITAINSSHGWCSVEVTLTNKSDGNTRITRELRDQFRFYSPTLEQILPRAVPSASGAEVRLTVTDILPGEQLRVTLAGVPATVAAQTERMILVRAGIVASAPENTDVVVSTVSGIPVLRKRLAFNYIDADATATLVTSTSPGWLPHSATRQQLTIRGQRVNEATAVTFTDPDTGAMSSCADVTPLEYGLTCSMPPMQYSYAGLLGLQLYRGDTSVAVFEIQVVRAPRLRAMLPGTFAPANRDAVIRLYIDDFPTDVPVGVQFTPLFTIAPRECTVHPDGLSFPLPRCRTDKGCALPHSGPVHLTGAGGELLVPLGQFTYTAEDTRVVVTAVSPAAGVFEQDSTYHIYGYGFADVDKHVAAVQLRRVDQDERAHKPLNVAFSRADASTLSLRLPTECLQPHACLDGTYQPVLLDERGLPLNADQAPVLLKLTNLRAPAVMYRLRLLERYDAKQETTVLKRVADALTDVLKLEPRRLWRARTERAGVHACGFAGGDGQRHFELHAMKASSVAKGEETDVYVVFRPLATSETRTPQRLAEELDAQVKDEQAPIYRALPTLDARTGAAAHEEVQWCPDMHAYAATCVAARDTDDHFMIVLGATILGIAVAGAGVGWYLLRRKQRQRDHARTVGLLDDAAGEYQQLAN